MLFLIITSASLPAQDTLRLAELQRDAVARDPRSAQSALLREQTTLRLANLRSERFPSLTVNGQAQHQSDITSVPVPGAIQPFKDTYEANLAARLRLVDPSRATRAAVEEAQQREGEARLAVALFAHRQAVNDAFFAALLVDRQRAVVEATIADLEVQLRLARERVAAGTALPGEAAMLDAELLRRRQTVDELSANRAASLAILGDLSHRRLDAAARLAAPSLAATVRDARLRRDSLRTRPEYETYRAGRDVARAREDALRTQDKPRLTAFSRAGYGRPGLNLLARSFDTFWLAGLHVEWSPFDWGSAQREREVIAVQRRVIDTEERAFTDRTQRAVIADMATIDRLERSLATDNAIIALREGVLRETRLRQSEGVVTLAELIDRETELQTARLARATHDVELEQARARFLTTLGLEVR